MSCDPQKVIQIALSQVGYREKETNEQLDDPAANPGSGNFTKYSRDLWEHRFFNGSKTGVEWCAVFVAWCMVEAYGVDAALRLLCQKKGSTGAGVKYAKQFFQNAGRFHNAPKPYDVIFFTRGHMGLVYDVDNTYVYTIEGNTDNQVKEHRYRLNDDGIDGYGRPDYENTIDEKAEQEEPTMSRTAYVANLAPGTSTVNLRTRPSASADRITKVLAGTVVDVLEEADGWARISTPDGDTGYMMSQFLKPLGVEDEESDEEPQEAEQEAETAPDEVTLTLPREAAAALFKALSEVAF